MLPQQCILCRCAAQYTAEHIRLHRAPRERIRLAAERAQPSRTRPPRGGTKVHEQRTDYAEHDTAVARMAHERIWPARHKPVVLTQGDLERKERAKRLVA